MSSSLSTSSSNDMCYNSSLLNAPKCPFKIPTKFPPALNLYDLNTNMRSNIHCDLKEMNMDEFALCKDECSSDSTLSMSSESEDEEQTPISILSMLEKMI